MEYGICVVFIADIYSVSSNRSSPRYAISMYAVDNPLPWIVNASSHPTGHSLLVMHRC